MDLAFHRDDRTLASGKSLLTAHMGRPGTYRNRRAFLRRAAFRNFAPAVHSEGEQTATLGNVAAPPQDTLSQQADDSRALSCRRSVQIRHDAGCTYERSREVWMDAFVIVGLLALVCGLLAVIACAVWWPTPDRRANQRKTAPPPTCAGRGRNHSSQPRVGVTGFEPATSSSRTKRATKLRHTP